MQTRAGLLLKLESGEEKKDGEAKMRKRKGRKEDATRGRDERRGIETNPNPRRNDVNVKTNGKREEKRVK